jgi:hypothetical protein
MKVENGSESFRTSAIGIIVLQPTVRVVNQPLTVFSITRVQNRYYYTHANLLSL